MKYFKIILSALIVFSFDTISIGQSNSTELLDVEGAISIADSSTDTPKEGTIRWTGQDFEGWNGVEWKSLTAGKNTISDIDNNEYDIVTIGNQTWMADNLRVTRFNDGTPIPLVDNTTSWSNLNSPAYTWYDNTRNDFGALYNFFAVADTNSLNICPVGWHVPSEPEWNELRDLLDTDPLPGILENDSGSKMRESGLANWQLPNTNSTNESGFKALPGGIRTAPGAFEVIYESAYFWSSKPINIYARAYSLFYLNEIFILFTSEKQAGMSVRCIQD